MQSERDLGVKQAWLNAMCIFQEDWLQWFTSSYAVINNTFSETLEFLKTVPLVLRCPWNTNEGETHSATQFWSFLHLVSDQSQTWYDIYYLDLDYNHLFHYSKLYKMQAHVLTFYSLYIGSNMFQEILVFTYRALNSQFFFLISASYKIHCCSLSSQAQNLLVVPQFTGNFIESLLFSYF